MDTNTTSQATNLAAIAAAFAPAFAAAVGVQKLLEISDIVVDSIASRLWPEERRAAGKKLVAGVLAFAVGFAAAFKAHFGLLFILTSNGAMPKAGDHIEVVDLVVTALVIAGGTEAVNSILKFLGYAKDEKKASTQPAAAAGEPLGLPPVERFAPTAAPPAIRIAG